MGNSITKKYDVPKDFTATAGHSQLWKIWPAKSKETGKDLSIWVFDKSELAKRKVVSSTGTSTAIDKAVVEQIYQIMKKDMSFLREIAASSGGTSNIVHFAQVVEETPMAIIFATERILCSLADLHSSFEGIAPSPKLDEIKRDHFSNSGSSSSAPSLGLSDIEISRGILNISEGLQYLHTVQRKLHLNLTPESIVLTPSGQWKLCGLGFSLGFQQGERQQLPSPYFLQNLPNSHMIRLEPDLRYSGPELTVGGFNPPGIRYLTPSADVFSLGLIAYEAYRASLDTTLSMTERKTSVIPMSSNSAAYHQAALENLSRLNYNFFPSTPLIQLVMDMIQLASAARIAIPNIINNTYFSTGPLQVLKLIDTLRSRDIGTQSSQLLILPSQLATLPTRLLEGTVLPCICQATAANIVLMPYAIPTHLFISQRMNKSKYCQIAAASVIQAFESNASIETMQAMLKNISFFMELFVSEGSNVAAMEAAMISLISNCLDKPQSSVHIAGFRILCEEKIRSYMSVQNIVNKIVPKVCREACKNADPNVKIHALYVLSLISPNLEKGFIIQNILPSLKYITDNEKNPVVSMCVLGNYNVIASILGPDYIARNIVPYISPLLVDRSLDRKQFELVGHLLRSMLFKVHELRAAEVGIVGSANNENNIFYRDERNIDSLDPFYAAKIMIQNVKKESVDMDVDPLPQNQFNSSTSLNNRPSNEPLPSFDHAVSNNSKTSSNIQSNCSQSGGKAASIAPYDPVKVTEVSQSPRGRLTKVGKKSSTESQSFPSDSPSSGVINSSGPITSSNMSSSFAKPPPPSQPAPNMMPIIPPATYNPSQYQTPQQSIGQYATPSTSSNMFPIPQQSSQSFDPFQTFSSPSISNGYNSSQSNSFGMSHTNQSYQYNSSYPMQSSYQAPQPYSQSNTIPSSSGMYGQAFAGNPHTNNAMRPASNAKDDPFDFLN